MGLFDKLKAEFIDIIEYDDPSNETLIYRFERYQNEIKYGAKLIVRPGQVAVFVNEGQVADVFQEGTYTLETKNIPILTTLKGWKYGFHSPFKAEVYFASTRNFTDLKWGTKNPIMMRDPEFGPIRLRAFGSYVMRISNPVNVIREVAGPDSHFTVEEISEQMKNVIITRFSDALAECKIPAIDLAAKYDELSKAIQEKMQPEFEEYGFELTKFLVENVSFPPEVEEAIDKRNSMGVIGNMNQYMQYQAAKSLEGAAQAPGGAAGEGMGLGIGFAMAQQMAGMMQPQQAQALPGQPMGQQGYFGQPAPMGQPAAQPTAQPAAAAPPPVPGQVQFHVVVNGAQAGPFPMRQLQQMVQQQTLTPNTLVWKQGMAAWTKAAEVPGLGALFAPPPPPPGPPPVPPM